MGIFSTKRRKTKVIGKSKSEAKSRIGDVYKTSNQRLKNYYKPKDSNARMAVLTNNKKGKQTVNAIVSKNSKNKLSSGYVELDSKKNKFLKKESVVSLETHSKVHSKKSEIAKGAANKRKVNVEDKSVFSNKIGRIHKKDRNKIKKALK